MEEVEEEEKCKQTNNGRIKTCPLWTFASGDRQQLSTHEIKFNRLSIQWNCANGFFPLYLSLSLCCFYCLILQGCCDGNTRENTYFHTFHTFSPRSCIDSINWKIDWMIWKHWPPTPTLGVFVCSIVLITNLDRRHGKLQLNLLCDIFFSPFTF